MTSFIDTVLEKAKADKQTIILPEGDDERTLQAAETILENGVANLIILGDVEAMQASPYKLDGARLIDPRTADEREEYAAALFELRKHKGMTEEKALALMDDVLYFGNMMIKFGAADGMV